MASALVRRQDVPNSWQVGQREPDAPKCRLHKGGTLFFSVRAAEVLGDRDCKVLCEFDESRRTIKFTAVEKLPQGIEDADTFPMRIRIHVGSRHPIAMLSCRALLRHVGFDVDDVPKDFPVAALDPRERSITLVVPS